MTTTIILSVTNDGYLTSDGATFSDARFGPADQVLTGNLSTWGQRTFGSGYEVRQAAIAFSFPAIAATDLVCSAAMQIRHWGANSPSRPRSMYFKPQNWLGGGLTVADFMTASQAQAKDTWGTVVNGQAASGKTSYTGSDFLTFHLSQATTSAGFIVMAKTSQDGAPTPIGDELTTFWSGNSSGTADDPRLVYTTVPRHNLVPVLGASVLLSDGSHAYLTFDSGVATLRHQANNLSTWSTALPADFFTYPNSGGAQGFALAVDDQDNVYVVGRNATAANAVSVKVYLKNPSGLGWSSSGPVRTAGMPGYVTSINNLAAAWHPTAGGTLLTLAAHTAGDATTGPTGNDVAYSLWDSTALRTLVSASRAVGSALGLMIPARDGAPTTFNTHGNETGTGLDVVADPVNRDWGYAFSFNKGTLLGENANHYPGRYIINATGTGFAHASTENVATWGVKDANGKLRVVPIGAGQAAVVSADDDGGFGITITFVQAVGGNAGFVVLGQVPMDAETITGFPTPADFSRASTWDVAYSSLENKLWLYFVKAGTESQVQRTSIDLNTYQATGVVQEVHDYTSAQKAMGFRLPRGRAATTHTWLDTALKANSGGAMTLQTEKSGFNVAPLAPTLTPHDNYDATVASAFTWTFNDSPGDTQSAYQLQVVDVADGSVDIDSGKTAQVLASRTVAASTLANAKSYRWRVMTWDALDVAGPWSDYGTFSTTAGGAVSILDPSVDNVGNIQTDDYLVKWSVAGTVQAAYRVILSRTDTGATVSDTGWIAGLDTQLLVGGMVTDVEHLIQVQVRNASLVVSGIGSRLITPSYAVPEIPLVTVTPFAEDGYTLITVDNPIPGQPANNAPEWDFETDALAVTPAGWAVTDGIFIASNTVAHKGSQSAKLATVGSPVRTYARAGSLGITEQVRYTCRFWAYATVATRVQAAIDWRQAGGVYISTSSGPETVIPANTWTLLSITAPAAAGAAEAGYGPTLPANPVDGTTVWVDEVALPEASDRPDVARNLILRRPVGSTDSWELVGECDPDGSFRDYTCPGWTPVEYMVRGEA